MPILLFMYPDEAPEILTGISLAIVFFNAFSGSIAYAKMKRIDYKSGLIFSAATIPGAVLGALTVSYINRNIFNIIFGCLVIFISIYMFFNPERKFVKNNKEQIVISSTRIFTDAEGTTHTYSFNIYTGIIISLFVGFLSSLLGIGGGIIHVPAMVSLLGFPVHIATATSHFVLAIMALTGTIVHIIDGSLKNSYLIILAIAIGVLGGAQIGAKLSGKIHGMWIIRALAGALGLVGIRMIIYSVFLYSN